MIIIIIFIIIYLSNLYYRIISDIYIFISLTRNTPVIRKQQKSVTGQEAHTPERPKNTGNIKIAGIKKNRFLESVITSEGLALPMAWKNVLPNMGKPHKGASIAIS